MSLFANRLNTRQAAPARRSSLREGESVIRTFHLHWTAWIGETLPVFFAIAVTAVIEIVLNHHYSWIGLIASTIAVVAMLGATANVRSTKLILTTERLIYRKGIFGTRRIELPLDRIFNLEVEQRLIGRLFGYGTLIVQSPSSTLQPIHHMTNPGDAQQEIYHAAELLQVADAQRKSEPLVPKQAAYSQRATLAQQLAELSEMHGDGILTDDEFRLSKARLLGRPTSSVRSTGEHAGVPPSTPHTAIDVNAWDRSSSPILDEESLHQREPSLIR